MPELQSPWSEGTITVPDDAVETYREQGWALVETDDTEDSKSDTKSDKPPTKSTAHRRTKSQ